MSDHLPPTDAHWPHRLAVALVCATFPLIWVGGLVTSYEAGMAVPDWPSTYGYNLLLYPWKTWLFGPFDIFVEHGHRLLGALVGIITIALVVATWTTAGSRLLRAMTLTALGLVIIQGVLGGMRVLFDARDIAKLHACVGPLFFALTTVLATVASRRWKLVDEGESKIDQSSATSLHRLAWITAGFSYSQIVIGAQLRHLSPGVDIGYFRTMLVFHLAVAALVAYHVGVLYVRVRRQHATEPWLRRPATSLAALVAVQLALGVSTWIVNYGFPVWFGNYAWAAQFVVRQHSLGQSLVTTAHVAIGSLIFTLSVLLAVRQYRLLHAWRDARAPSTPQSEAMCEMTTLGVAL